MRGKDMNRLTVILLGVTLIFTGCNSNQQVPKVIPEQKLIEMPNEMPADFAFSVRYGVNGKNVIDSFNGIVVKDLIIDGTAEAEITFTNEELKSIYEHMVKINILETKDLNKDTGCQIEPHGDDTWKIRTAGNEKTIEWSGKYCDATEDVELLMDLRNFVLEIVKAKEAYKALPEPEGAYE